jgi:hypothetical protein
MFQPLYTHPSPCSYPHGDCECPEETPDPRVAGAAALVDLADPDRYDRSDDVRVLSASEKRDRPLLNATVASAGGDRTYRVRILLAVEGGRGRFWCDCPDHRKRTNVCKHIVAVARRYFAARNG